MAGTVSFVRSQFTGGEISQSAQGAMDVPAYKISLNLCQNWIPTETGGLQRRPGSRHIAPARGGKTGKLISFAFLENFPYQMEFTDGFLRFTTGPALVMTNDAQAILAISSANPAVVQTTSSHGWSTGNSVAFNSLGANNPLLQNRQFIITVVDPTHFSIADAVTGTAINGSTLGAFVSGNVTRILEIATIYGNGTWSSLRSVQAETRTVLLNGAHPQVLQVASQPSATQFATFTLGAADFIDGPYLDPIPGSIVTSSALNGVVTLTLSFAIYDGNRAYNIGDFVSFNGISYQSLTALNQNHEPDFNPGNWKVVNGGAAVNAGQGFVASDIGRLIRLLSEPQAWNKTSTYATGTVVSYTDGLGGTSYWTATGAIPANTQPGTSTAWALNATGALWTWGQITSVSGSGLIAPATAFGTLSGGGGLGSAFDGNTSKSLASAANFSVGIATRPVWSATNWASSAVCQYNGVLYQTLCVVQASNGINWWAGYIGYGPGDQVQYNVAPGLNLIYQCNVHNTGIAPGSSPDQSFNFWSPIFAISAGTPPSVPATGEPRLPTVWQSIGPIAGAVERVFIGQHYATAQAIQSATLYPSNDGGISNSPNAGTTILVSLRGKATAPANASDGTLLASTAIGNTTSPVTLTSNDHVTAWNYIWFDISTNYAQPLPDNGSHVYTALIAASQVQFFSPTVTNGSVIQAQIRGGPLLYSQPINTWQLGVYSDTTGWPTCGAYHESRIWLGGVVSNRFDSCVSNGLKDVQLNFSPTSTNGTVSADNSISYICDGEDSNQFLWMKSDQQGVLAGTAAGEWLISAPSQGPMSPTNIKAVRVTRIGCANTEPRRTEHTLVVVQKFARKLVEFFADVFSGKYTAPNLSERAKHLTVNGIAEIAYQQELAPTLWARRNDGGLIGATYKRDTLMTSQGPTIIGWHRAPLGSGRAVESISVGPSVGGNLENLTMITNDNNTGVRHLELMTDLLDEGFTLSQCWFLDDGIAPSSTVIQPAPTGGPYGSLLVNGLWAHNGKLVTAFIAGLDCGDYTVSSGSITVPFGDGLSAGTASGLFTAALVQSFTTLPAVIGFTYNSDGQLVRPVAAAEVGSQSGPGFAKLGRQHYAAAFLYGCVNGSISFGTDFVTLDPAKLTAADDTPYQVNQLWSGIWRDQIESQLDFDGMIAFRVSRPLPAFVLAVSGFGGKADV